MEPNNIPIELSLCETIAAITVHARLLGKKGKCLGGGADTLSLCGQRVEWDLLTPFSKENVRCRSCREKLNGTD